MPHLVQMRKKYGPQGFAVVTVATGEENDRRPKEKVHASIVKYLTSIKATGFTNVFLDEPDEFWTKKLGFPGIPYLFLFNREGKYQRFDPSQIEEEYANIDRLVAEWLKAPAPKPAGGAAAPGQVEIKNVTKAGLSEEIARHKGKVVLLNFWGFL
jgi:hypothetical protein